jgi:Domain of unknown function (DUF4384)
MRTPMMWILVAAAGCALGQPQQQPNETGARQLYYFAVTKKDELPPIRKDPPPPSAPANGVVHLGFRYSIALVNPDTNIARTVDPDRIFRKGECFALQLEANRSGYLYVLARQSSGSWKAMLPTPEMSEESNILDPGRKMRIPAEYCFEVSDPPGSEVLTVILSRDPRDVYQLNQGIRGAEPPPSEPRRQPATMELASARLVNSEVERMARQYGTRDLLFHKIEKPQDPQESPFSVYVVNSSDKPASMVMTKVTIRHQ